MERKGLSLCEEPMLTVPFTMPASPRPGGHKYVCHCHILEHEEHDMMRPLVAL